MKLTGFVYKKPIKIATMKKLFICITLVLSVFCLLAQDIKESASKVKKQIISSEYDRSALTIIGLKSDGPLADQVAKMIDTLKVSDKFYSNDIGVRNIPFHTTINLFDKAQQEQVFKTDVAKLLDENKVGQGIMAKWFNRQADGTFNTDVLRERGIYNSDDSDLSIASASKRGESALMDAGLGLVDHSYVLVLGFSNLITMDQYYTNMNAPTESRKMNGVRGDLIGLLYKLNLTDSVSAVFFQNMWINKGDDNAQEKIASFNANTFPLVSVKKLIMPVQSTQYNAGLPFAPKVQKNQDELLRDLVNNSMKNVIDQMTFLVSDFKVKAQIYQTNPIAIKIGKKEGLGFDQRYFVFENRQTRNGEQFSSRRGVIKSKSVADNRSVTTGETTPSIFYQVAGRKLDNMGMFVEQRIDAGLNLFLGNTQDGLSGFTGRAEYYIGRQVKVPSLKMYVEGAYNSITDEFTIVSTTGKEDLNFIRISGGLNKDFYLTKNIHFGPFVGYGFETAKGKDSEYKIETNFIECGARLGFNLTYNIQLVGSANYYLMMTPAVKDKDGTVIEDPKDYDVYFPERGGLGLSYGIRFMF